jgi:DNA (cytosine-5)-methyltransferase 1
MNNDLYLADLFAGGGGFSTGIAEACKQLGKKPDLVAINHWKTAVDTHTLNYPWARHLCTGLDAVHPTVEVKGGRLNLLAASPECTHHSNARGGKPMNDQSRSSAWLILKWLQELYVEAVLIENVQEFEDWGPLGADGRPLKSMKGQLFDQFIANLKALGYNVDWRVANAANYGGATTRERLFIMARRGRNKRIMWPDHTHAQLGDLQPEMFGNQMQRWRPARDIIDWTLPSQSIFTRKKPLAANTLERIAAGLRKFGGKAAEPFLVVLRQHMGARSINDPIPTLTASGTHVGLCEPFIVPQFGEREGQSPRFHSLDAPLPTVTGHGAGALVQPFIAELRGGKYANSIDDPLSTVTTKGAHHALVEPFLLSMEHGNSVPPSFMTTVNHGMPGGANRNGRRVYDLDNPMPTITTVDAWGVVQPFIITAGGPVGQGRTPKDINHPLPTVLTDDRHALIEPLIVSYYGTQNVSTVRSPLPTVTTKDRFGLVQFGDGLYLDIHFRMLTWRELASAMGFPAEYVFAGNRSDKVKQIGNAVEVKTATAMAMAALAA